MKEKNGFTLMEILIVVSILVLITILLLVNVLTQIHKTNDSRRKTDLYKIQKAFEEYFNDKQCYPSLAILDSCGSASLAPYLPAVLCDPITKVPYLYMVGQPSVCSGYRVCTKLENLNDPDITRIGCDPVQGCGWASGYNYCVSAGLPTTTTIPGGGGGEEEPIPGTPTATPEPGFYACSPGGGCNNYADPVAAGCPVTYAAPGCLYNGVFQCQFVVNRCTIY